jgi:hypothetical protein
VHRLTAIIRRLGSVAIIAFPDFSRRRFMTWIKPEFEFVDLCSEVTSYLYRR